MKKISKIFLSLLCIISFATNAFAASYASNSITVYSSGDRYEYVSGLPIYYMTASSYNLYILNTGTHYENYATLSDPQQANAGFAYIVNNSNVTNSSYKNYYIAQVAILWYQDYLNGNDANISSTLKNYITSKSNDTVCYYISKLVNNAKNYSSNGNSIKFLDKEITFTRNGSYYYSNVIDVETYNLNTNPSVRLYNAPSSATIINNTVTRNGTGSFQIRIPVSSLSNFTEKDFEVYITGGSSNNTVYKYSNYGTGEAIYSRTYSTNGDQIEASMPASIKGMASTNVRINVLDRYGDYINGLSYSIYSGDCTNKTCYSDDLIHTFTTSRSYTTLNNVLSSGTYTLVKKSSSNSYNLPSKLAFNVSDTNSVQEITIEEDNYYNNNNYNNNNNNNNNNDYYDRYYDRYYDDYYNDYYYNRDYRDNDRRSVDITDVLDTLRKVTIYNKINDSRDIINIYTKSSVLVGSYRSNQTNYSINLSEGTYYIVDSKNNFDKLYFKVTADGDLLVKYDDDYELARYITLDDDSYNESTVVRDRSRNRDNGTIEKRYDEDTNTYYIDGLDDEISISIENEANADVKVEWLSNIVDCPITSLDSTVKYIIGAMIISTGLYLVVRNAKKKEINI